MKPISASLVSCAALLILVAGCTTTTSPPMRAAPPPAAVPASLQVPATQVLLLRAPAVGVQIYECQVSPEDSKKYDWVFKAPDAQLFNASGKAIIKHFAGPTWEHTDGSAVVGEVTAKDTGPDSLAIPWLLLSAKSTSGHGILSRVQFIQRIHTVGGKAPAGGCGVALMGSEVRMQYSADYLFYGPKS
jgi:hypothetical protein